MDTPLDLNHIARWLAAGADRAETDIGARHACGLLSACSGVAGGAAPRNAAWPYILAT
jgi:hypothetical protein